MKPPWYIHALAEALNHDDTLNYSSALKCSEIKQKMYQSENMNWHQGDIICSPLWVCSLRTKRVENLFPNYAPSCSSTYMGNFHPPITRTENWLLPHLNEPITRFTDVLWQGSQSTRDVLWDQIFYDLCGKREIPRDQLSNLVAVCGRNGSLGKYNLP